MARRRTGINSLTDSIAIQFNDAYMPILSGLIELMTSLYWENTSIKCAEKTAVL